MDKVSYTSQLTQHLDTTMAMVNSTVPANSCMSNDAFALLELIGFPTFSPHELHLLVSDDVNRVSFVNSVMVPSLSEYTSLCSRSLNGSTTLNVMNNGKFQRASSSHVLKQDGSLLKSKKSLAQIEVRRNDGSEINLSKLSGSGPSENSEQIQSVETKLTNTEMSSRKRKGSTSAKDEDGNAKCSKQAENGKKENVGTKTKEGGKEGYKEKATEPRKDYIHVRARRGEATDSHSLAERVRREKISERMKLLQDLVPGCNKVTGKALMLEEIINYVQSLQRQFMSMKLASVNSELELNMNNILSKDQKGIVTQQMNHLDSSTEAALYNNYDHQFHQNVQQLLHNSNISSGPLSKCSVNHVSLDAPLCSNFGIQLPYVDVFSATVPQLPAFWEDDLHIIQNEFS